MRRCARVHLVPFPPADWRKELDDVRAKFPMQYPDREDVIAPQHAVEVREAARTGALCSHCCVFKSVLLGFRAWTKSLISNQHGMYKWLVFMHGTADKGLLSCTLLATDG